MPVPARGLKWVAQLFSFQMLPACPEGRDRPEAPDGHAQQEGRCQTSQEKPFQVLREHGPQLRAEEGALCRESGGPCVGHMTDPWRVLLL